MKTGFLNERKMPFVVEPDGEKESKPARLISICERERDFLHENPPAGGAILLRGFKVERAADFERVVPAMTEAEG